MMDAHLGRGRGGNLPDGSAADLRAEHCIPCRGGVPTLPRAEAEALLATIPAWSLDMTGTHLLRDIRTKSFADALSLVQRIAAVAEQQRHHPDIAFGWGYVRLSLQTYAIKGLHRNDFILAAHIEALIAPQAGNS